MTTSTFRIRPAVENEAGTILKYIKLLAEYEKMLDEVEATEEGLRQAIFVNHEAEVVFAEERNGDAYEIVGFALFFHNFSTFIGHKGLYLEDLFVLPEKRGKGYGKALLKYLAKTALERGCGRMEWVCLDWNEPSINFYKSIGAVPMDEWTIYRLTENAMKAFAL